MAALAAAGLLALASCGSSGPTKSQYVAKANAICASARTQTTPLIRQLTAAAVGLASPGANAARSARQMASAVGRLQSVSARELSQLRKLQQPSGDHAAIERFLTPLAGLVDAIGRAGAALRGGQPQRALAQLAEVQPTSQQVTRAANAYGMRQCGSVLTALG